MSTFKSPQLHICGRLKTIIDCEKTEESSFYIKMQFTSGDDWKLMSQGSPKFQTFEAESNYGIAAVQHPFNVHYIAENVRGWPRIILQVWKVDSYGRHNIYGYGTAVIPMASGDHEIDICCWRPIGTWYDRFIGANSELQHPGVIVSSLSRYGLRTFSSCIVKLEANVIGRNFQLHGVVTNSE